MVYGKYFCQRYTQILNFSLGLSEAVLAVAEYIWDKIWGGLFRNFVKLNSTKMWISLIQSFIHSLCNARGSVGAFKARITFFSSYMQTTWNLNQKNVRNSEKGRFSILVLHNLWTIPCQFYNHYQQECLQLL